MSAAFDLKISSQFSNWYESFRYAFMRMGLGFGYCQEEVQDIINQFFLDLLEKNIDPVSIENPKAYLSIAFRRKLIDHYRKNSSSRLIGFKADDEVYTASSIQDTLEQIESNTELVNAIRKAYEKLPARCRKVIDLKFYQCLSTDEIALHTGLSKRSVYNNLFEGIKLLREEFNHITPDIPFMSLLSCLGFILITAI